MSAHKSRIALASLLFLATALMACSASATPTAVPIAVVPTVAFTATPMPSATAVPPTPTLAIPTIAPTMTVAPIPNTGATSGSIQIPRNPAVLRAAWVHDNSIATRAKVDEIIRRAAEGHINVIVADVFDQGMALYDSKLVNKHPEVASGFDPLAYLVQQAHQRGIQVQAWFVNGPVDYKGQSSIIAQHPDWAIVGADGGKMAWMNFERPDVRQFISDLMWEVVNKYGVDGLFFDFTRYPGPGYGFDSYSISAFNSTHSFSLEDIRYSDLPAYGYFEGNPISQITTAKTLASFSDGTPAVTINTFGPGKVVVLNWKASERQVAADSTIMRNSIQQLLETGGQVYSYKPDGTLDDNSSGSLADTSKWLHDLGWSGQEIGSQALKNLSGNSVLVVSYGYDISEQAATLMSDFVNRGGGLIFIDGPRSNNLETIRTLTGLQGRGKHFAQWTFMLPVGDNPLLPVSDRGADLTLAQSRNAQLNTFQKQGVDALIQGVYQRVKASYPQVDISVTVTNDQKAADEQTMQDWRAWLDGGYVDYIVPRGYVEIADQLGPILSDWEPLMQQYKHVTLGVSNFSGKHNQRDPKDASDLLDEMARAQQAGSFGIMLWNLDYMNDDQLKALAAGPFH